MVSCDLIRREAERRLERQKLPMGIAEGKRAELAAKGRETIMVAIVPALKAARLHGANLSTDREKRHCYFYAAYTLGLPRGFGEGGDPGGRPQNGCRQGLG